MRPVKKGSTDQSVVIRIVDSTTGAPETAVEHDSAGIDLWYRREGAAKTSITEAALSALTDAHSDGGIEHIGDGYYRLDLPDAAFATGANGVAVGGTVTGMVVIGCYVPLVDYDPQDATSLGISRLDAAVSSRSSHSAADVWAVATRVLTAGTNIALAKGTGVTGFNDLDANGIRSAVGLSSANLATLIAAVQTVVDAIKLKTDALPSDPADASDIAGSIASLASTLATILGHVDTEIASIKAKTDNLPTDPADESSIQAAIAAVAAAIAALNNLSSAQAQSAAAAALTAYDPPTNAELEARTVAAASYALEATLTAIKGLGWATETLVNLSSRIPAALTAGGNMKADVLAINGVTAAAARLAKSAGQIIPGTVDNTGHTPTSTVFEADDITEATADHFIGRVVLWTTGALAGQATTVTDYALVSGRGRFTVDAMTEAPANNDEFVLI